MERVRLKSNLLRKKRSYWSDIKAFDTFHLASKNHISLQLRWNCYCNRATRGIQVKVPLANTAVYKALNRKNASFKNSAFSGFLFLHPPRRTVAVTKW